MLVCGIIDELKRSTTAPSFFFCQDTDTRINSATGVLRGLIHQLVSQQPSLMSHLRQRYDQAGSALFQDANAWVALANIFTDMTKGVGIKTSYIIVDGLDECVVDLPKLLDLIVGTTLLSPNVKWLVSSRNDAHIAQRFKAFSEDSKLSLELDQNAEQVARAVDIYIDHKLSRLESLQDVSLREQVRCELRQKANGTFLWVALMMQELEAPESWDPLAVVQEAPAGLDQLYDRMMNRIQQLKRKTVEICQLLLSTAVVAYRPLYLTEMGSLCGLQSPTTALAGTVRKIISLSGSFLTIRNEQISFIHQSAKDYLSAKMETALLPSRSEIHYDLFTQSLRLMSSTLQYDMYKLVDVGLHIDEVKVPVPDPLATARYSCVHWVDHLHDSVLSGRPHYIESLQVRNVVHVFLEKHFLYWLEALSLCRSMSAGVLSMTKLVALLKENQCANALTELIHDAHRFVLHFKRGIENSPLQAYVSALLFSPRSSLVKKLFRHQEPNHILVIRTMDDGWSTCLQTLEGNKPYGRSVAVSPDSNHVASSSSDGTIIIWHVSSGTYLQTLKGHSSATMSVAFSPNSAQLATGSGYMTVSIWDISSGTCLKTLEGHGGGVISVAFSPDSSQLASASWDKTVKIWDASSGACLHTLNGHTGPVQSVSFSHDSVHISSSSTDKTVKIWNISSGACLKTLEGHGGGVLSVAFSPDSSQLASASWDKTVKIWDFRSGACTLTLEGHNSKIVSIAFSHDSARLASASDDRTIKIWDLHSGTSPQTLKGLGGDVVSVAFVPDSTWLASTLCDGVVKIWDTSSSTFPPFEGHSDLVGFVAFSPDSTLLASASRDSTVKIWDTSSGSCVKTLVGHCDAVNSIAFSQDSKLASGSDDRTVKIWDMKSGACLRTLQGPMYFVNSVAYSHNSAMLASSGANVKIWDAVSGTCLLTLGISPHRIVQIVAFSHDSTLLATVGSDFTIEVLDPRSGACLQKLGSYGSNTAPVPWSRSNRLVWASNDKTIKIWDAMSGLCLRTLEIQSDLVSSVAHMSVLASPRSVETVTHLPFHPEATLRSDGTWIFDNAKKLLWLPTEYRPVGFAVSGRCVALGASSGKVWMCRFS